MFELECHDADAACEASGTAPASRCLATYGCWGCGPQWRSSTTFTDGACDRIFVVSLAAIASERFDRTKVALVGAVLNHVAVDEDFSDVGLAEIFLHHRVLVVPVERDGRPVGVITRTAFFRRLAERFLET